ncbi:unnamed protein product [Protopolystoma xenopodis]|uniref:Uncharacterized protein n=1 Tax=Protopolystoma xenopodis TaxID=117903 RepID=A0A448X378_9PLAT|nr:unnamed protein product [Protopolystoma xenopodis]
MQTSPKPSRLPVNPLRSVQSPKKSQSPFDIFSCNHESRSRSRFRASKTKNNKWQNQKRSDFSEQRGEPASRQQRLKRSVMSSKRASPNFEIPDKVPRTEMPASTMSTSRLVWRLSALCIHTN